MYKGQVHRIQKAWFSAGWRRANPLGSLGDYFRESPRLSFKLLTHVKRDFGEKNAIYLAFCSFYTTWLLMAIVPAMLIMALSVYKKYLTSSVRHALREEVMLEVRSQMADYAPLDDGPGNQNGGSGYQF